MTVGKIRQPALLPGYMSPPTTYSPSASKFDALTITAGQLQEQFVTGSLTSVEVVEEYISRIVKYNGYLRAITSIAPGALDQAKALDEKRATGNYLGPLHGIPIVLKDSIATHPGLGMDTTAGAWALVGSQTTANATLVDRLLDAGAIILGKTSMTELTFQKGDNLPCGWSAVAGQGQSAYVRGGFDPTDSVGGHSGPGGSSSGSAIAVSAGLAPLSIGVETEGSIIQPATRAALYAIKPTLGIIPGDGFLPLSYAYDTPGPMAKSPADIATLLTALVDSSKTEVPTGGYQSALTGRWGDLKVGTLDPEIWQYGNLLTKEVPEATEQIIHDTKQAYDRIKNLVKDYHHHVPLRTEADFMVEGSDAFMDIISADFKKDVERYLSGLEKSNVRTLEEMINWNIAHKDKALPEGYENQATLINRLDTNLSASDREKRVAHTRKVGSSIDDILEKHNIDVIIGPADSWLTQLAAATNYPIATLPLSTLRYNGRPIGLSAVTRAHNEVSLLRLMAAWESSFGPRALPEAFLEQSKVRTVG